MKYLLALPFLFPIIGNAQITYDYNEVASLCPGNMYQQVIDWSSSPIPEFFTLPSYGPFETMNGDLLSIEWSGLPFVYAGTVTVPYAATCFWYNCWVDLPNAAINLQCGYPDAKNSLNLNFEFTFKPKK
jgi:hypothetical protein